MSFPNENEKHPLIEKLLQSLNLNTNQSWPPEQTLRFLNEVSSILRDLELDRELLEQSLKIASDEMKENYQHLVQSAKMASLGEMAGGVAHEINNPLFVIMGKASLLTRQIEAGKPPGSAKLQEVAKSIEHHCDRISRIVKGLKNFSRDGSQDPFLPVTLNEIFSDTLALCQRKIEKAGIKLTLPEQIPDLTLHTRPAQVPQVLVNLLNNALDAVNESAEQDQSLEKAIEVSLEITADFLDFYVIDSGPGVPEEIEQKIMEPFFTTKPAGVGTGLGLSVSMGIARDHEGFLKIDRRRGPSCFHLRISRHLNLKSDRKGAVA